MSTVKQRQGPETAKIWISQPGGVSNCYSDPGGRFTIVASRCREVWKENRDPYSIATAFIQGGFEVHGDLFAAIRYFSNQSHSRARQFLLTMLAKLERLRIGSILGSYRAAQRNIHFHYDRSNQFYAQFLDSRMVYSAAYFEDPDDSLEKAQTQKLDRICKDLVLRPGERFLDVGCGWGGLVLHAAKQFGARAVGCTLSQNQFEFARSAIKSGHLEESVTVNLCDYRRLDGCFDKVASVGMFEHVGRRRLAGYFQKVFSLLNRGGLFVNRGVIRPVGISDTPETLFLQKHVFPGGELVHLHDVIREGERAGFDVVGLRDLRLNYALTCRKWVANLQRNAESCRALIGDMSFRIWLLYLAASAVNFEDGTTSAAQVLFSKSR